MLLLLSIWLSLGPLSPARPSQNVRTEYFAIEAQDDDPDAAAEVLIALRCVPGPRRVVLERDIDFRRGPLRVREVARPRPAGSELVWRAFDAERGHTWHARTDAHSGTVASTLWGTGSPAHATLAAGGRAFAELELLEAARTWSAPREPVPTLRPLAARVEALELRTRPVLAALFGGHLRRVTLVDAEGSGLASYLFLGEECLAIRLQSGSPWAMRVSGERYHAELTRFPRVIRADERRAELLAQIRR